MKRFILFALSALLFFACEHDDNDFTVQIIAQPSRAHAPALVSFSLDRADSSNLANCLADWDFGDGVRLSGLLETSHRYHDAGNYSVEVILRCGDKKAKTSLNLEIFPSVDLELSGLQFQPRDINTGLKLSLSYQIANLGPELKIATTLSIFLTESDPSSMPKLDESAQIYSYSIESMPASPLEGSQRKESIEIPLSHSLRTGAYYVAVVIDPKEQIGDLDRRNNTIFSDNPLMLRNQSTDGADLVVNYFNISPEETRVLSSAKADFEIANEGSGTGVEFKYEIWRGLVNEENTREGGELLMEGSLQGIASGSRQRIQDVFVPISPAIETEGLYYFWLVLDSSNLLVERDETNNELRSSSPIQVRNETILDADILVENLSFSPQSTALGGSFSANLHLYNQGSQATGSFICTLYLSEDQNLEPDKDRVVGSINVYDLIAQQRLVRESLVEVPTNLSAGDYWFFVFCDSSGVVTEANEDNNIQRAQENIELVGEANIDLSIEAITLLTSSQMPEGEPFEINTKICNSGRTGAGPSVLLLETIDACDLKRSELLRTQIGAIEADSCTELKLSLPISCNFWCDRYDLRLTADASYILKELNENNNQRSLATTLQVLGSNCLCEADKFEANQNMSSAKPLPPGKESLTLCNNDEDWFELSVAEGESFEINLSHLYSRAPLSLSLWQGTQRLEEQKGSDELFISKFNHTSHSTYFIQVSAPQGKGNHYDIDLQKYSPSIAKDIAIGQLEIQGDALDISEQREVSFVIYNLGENISETFTLEIFLSPSTLLDSQARSLAKRQYQGINTRERRESLMLALPADTAAGSWRLIAKIDSDEQITESNETNNLARSRSWEIERSCWDKFDPNENLGTARLLNLTGTDVLRFNADSLRVCQDNPDFYKLIIPSGYSLSITATNEGVGDFDLVLYDYMGNEIKSARTANRIERLELPLHQGEEAIFLEVFQLKNPYNTNESRYALEVTASPAPSWLQCSDAFETNNFTSSAYSLISAFYEGGEAALCPGNDTDFYHISLSAGQRLSLKIQSASQSLRAALYNPGGSFAALLTDLNTQTFDYTAPFDGNYHIKIYSNSSEIHSQDYRLILSGFEGADLGLSDLILSPENPNAGSVIQAKLKLSNQGKEPLNSFKLSFLLLQSNNEITLLEKSYNQSLAIGAKLEIIEKLDLPPQTSGLVQIKVAAALIDTPDVYLPNNETILPLKIIVPCKADPYEYNNNFENATTLENTNIQAKICENDEDWFKFTSAANKKYNISINFSHAAGDLDLYLYDENRSLIAVSRGQSDFESITFDASPQSYYILIKALLASTQNTYNLSVE